VINPLHHLLQPFELQRFQHFPGQGFKFFIVDHESSLPLFLFNLSEKTLDALYQKMTGGARIVAGGGHRGFYQSLTAR
jgi:hypothetical protein